MFLILNKYHNSVEIVLVIEPDSLPNLVTNGGDPHCGSTATNLAYRTGVAYAIKKFSVTERVAFVEILLHVFSFAHLFRC